MGDPYQQGLLSFNPYAKKREVNGQLVVVLEGHLEQRGLQLITPRSRAVLKNEIHEIIVTDEIEPVPGDQVNRIAYLGFVEIITGGILLVGDEVMVHDKVVGKIAGFDESHLPNHLNIVVLVDKRFDGVEAGLSLEDGLVFKSPKGE